MQKYHYVCICYRSTNKPIVNNSDGYPLIYGICSILENQVKSGMMRDIVLIKLLLLLHQTLASSVAAWKKKITS